MYDIENIKSIEVTSNTKQRAQKDILEVFRNFQFSEKWKPSNNSLVFRHGHIKMLRNKTKKYINKSKLQ